MQNLDKSLLRKYCKEEASFATQSSTPFLNFLEKQVSKNSKPKDDKTPKKYMFFYVFPSFSVLFSKNLK
jgi:hypothetical protein